MDRKRSAWILAVVSGVLGGMLLVACSNDPRPRAVESDANPLSRMATAGEVEGAAIDSAEPPGAVVAAAATPAEAAVLDDAVEKFAAAIVSHDLTGLTMSFTPQGLAQAQALTARTGTQRGQGVHSAELTSLRELPAGGGRWEAIHRLDAPRGLVDLRTIWQWFDASGWRIVSIELLT